MLPPLPAQLPQSVADVAGWAAFPGELAHRARERQAARAAAAAAIAEAEVPAVRSGVAHLEEAWDAIFGDEAADDRMVDFLSVEVPAEANEEAAQLYEMLLVAGASAVEGQAKITELYSP